MLTKDFKYLNYPFWYCPFSRGAFTLSFVSWLIELIGHFFSPSYESITFLGLLVHIIYFKSEILKSNVIQFRSSEKYLWLPDQPISWISQWRFKSSSGHNYIEEKKQRHIFSKRVSVNSLEGVFLLYHKFIPKIIEWNINKRREKEEKEEETKKKKKK